jgi:hypothetical protein
MLQSPGRSLNLEPFTANWGKQWRMYKTAFHSGDGNNYVPVSRRCTAHQHLKPHLGALLTKLTWYPKVLLQLQNRWKVVQTPTTTHTNTSVSLPWWPKCRWNHFEWHIKVKKSKLSQNGSNVHRTSQLVNGPTLTAVPKPSCCQLCCINKRMGYREIRWAGRAERSFGHKWADFQICVVMTSSVALKPYWSYRSPAFCKCRFLGCDPIVRGWDLSIPICIEPSRWIQGRGSLSIAWESLWYYGMLFRREKWPSKWKP